MNIIFGDIPKELSDNHTLLELDEFVVISKAEMVKCYCVVDSVPLTEFSSLEEYKQLHQELIDQYRLKNFEYCKSAIVNLIGRWNGELDTFYEHLAERIEHYISNPPDEFWHWALIKD
jgi:hypothetical protein